MQSHAPDAADAFALSQLMFPTVPQCISVVAQHGIADVLADVRLSVGELAERTGTDSVILGKVLRLLVTFSMEEVSAAARQALQFSAISFDAVKHLLLCAIERRPPRLDLENYPHLPVAEVALTRAADYQVLLQSCSSEAR